MTVRSRDFRTHACYRLTITTASYDGTIMMAYCTMVHMRCLRCVNKCPDYISKQLQMKPKDFSAKALILEGQEGPDRALEALGIPVGASIDSR